MLLMALLRLLSASSWSGCSLAHPGLRSSLEVEDREALRASDLDAPAADRERTGWRGGFSSTSSEASSGAAEDAAATCSCGSPCPFDEEDQKGIAVAPHPDNASAANKAATAAMRIFDRPPEFPKLPTAE